jgi:putative heme iron utilization protein
MKMQTPIAFDTAAVQELIKNLNKDHTEDLLLCSQVYGKQNTAISAKIVEFDADGMDLEIDFRNNSPKLINIHFSSPLPTVDDVNRHFNELVQRAHQLQGHNSREVVGRTIAKKLPAWLRK